MSKTEPFKNPKREKIYGDFFLWADRFFIVGERLNLRFFKEDIREVFFHDCPQHKSLSHIGFHQMLERFALHHDFQLNPGCIRMCGGRKYMLPNADLVLLVDDRLPFEPRDKTIILLHEEFPYLKERSIYRHWKT